MNSKPIIGITMGDPAGCGPEITIRALAKKEIYDRCRPLVVGDIQCMRDALRVTNHPEIKLNRVSKPSEGKYEFGSVDVLHLDLVDMGKFQYGKVSAMCGNAAFQCVKKVIDLAMKGEIDATVTNALNKEAMNLAGHHFDGHTEIYAQYTGTEKYAMMLANDNLRVIHVSTHVSMREACGRVKRQRVLDVIRLADQGCRALDIERPKVGVCGLNPHAGEDGMFGREEIDEIMPAIRDAQAEGINAIGPLPPDTAFSKALGGWYDIVVCMYHDQGHIPLKVIGFVYNKQEKKWEAVAGVNVTLGLPIIRVSVDHGTAFGHAGTGVANELSLVNSIDYALRMAQHRKEVKA
ncbi:4-hydroxythreonine-4-phosphate dehydrogenase PdxA [Caproiciproducens sp. NJN-50]|uniref:4-hydroxythreonine-4-phosphate dehydrogenase PdxA n=1 Tax=Acutalibacteraceae TaxID=3082771 RepID=UPI000FFE24B5|nr:MULTISPECIES: 4-hydroxythreonine-4-phosphate dehydrogenase PdxA [Acutalibacteraceae]QAT50113.1 4-hydroxythreonine-4-phosphate dehydrogenase PdxA [Caproiciproducens sp. NJN-50]